MQVIQYYIYINPNYNPTTKKMSNDNMNIGKNVNMKIDENNVAHITIDLNKDHGTSQSGKTNIVATTGGNKNINGVFIGINAYKYAEEKASPERLEEKE